MNCPELEGIGLTKSEILVYTTLLRTGQSSTGRIVREAGISSGKIYEILDRLIEKGLVSYILRNNVKYFSASEPHKIREYAEKKKQEMISKEKEIESLIPKLKELKKAKETEYSAEIHMGIDGIKTALVSLIENLEKDSELMFLGGSGVRKTAIDLVWKKVVKIMNKNKIRSRFIVTDASDESKKELENYKRQYSLFTYRFAPGFHLAPIVIGKNQTIILNFREQSAIVIRSSTIAEQFRFFFESMWKISKPD
ncbi:hypothetical protein GF345_03010 [Candidatus Woesearchaeota archaeon]|nr:hypothetical protein [Candidatus Woesearchaeota archaeon]